MTLSKVSFQYAAVITLVAALFMASPVAAQGVAPPAATSPAYISLLYYRMTGQSPDFEAWAKASDDYVNANSFDKDMVRREKAAEVARAFHLVTYDDPLVVESMVTLSSYSRSKRGFFIESFRPDTFYPMSFLDRNYALVPLDLMDYQWMSVEDESVQQKIEQAIGSKRVAKMFLYLNPTFADKDHPLKMDKKDFWLLSGRVHRLQIFDDRGKELLWEGYGRHYVGQKQQELLDLYK